MQDYETRGIRVTYAGQAAPGPWRGDNTGRTTTALDLAAGELITQVYLGYGQFGPSFDMLLFVTNTGRHVGGGNNRWLLSGQPPVQAFPCPVGQYRLAFFKGMVGTPLKDLQLGWAPVTGAASRGSPQLAASLTAKSSVGQRHLLHKAPHSYSLHSHTLPEDEPYDPREDPLVQPSELLQPQPKAPMVLRSSLPGATTKAAGNSTSKPGLKQVSRGSCPTAPAEQMAIGPFVGPWAYPYQPLRTYFNHLYNLQPTVAATGALPAITSISIATGTGYSFTRTVAGIRVSYGSSATYSCGDMSARSSVQTLDLQPGETIVLAQVRQCDPLPLCTGVSLNPQLVTASVSGICCCSNCCAMSC
jgi:hypothetical protein